MSQFYNKPPPETFLSFIPPPEAPVSQVRSRINLWFLKRYPGFDNPTFQKFLANIEWCGQDIRGGNFTEKECKNQLRKWGGGEEWAPLLARDIYVAGILQGE